MLLGFLFFSFVVWSEGKTDGFDEEKLFDLILVSIVSAILFSRIFFANKLSASAEDFFGRVYRIWEPGYNRLGALVGFLLPVFVLCQRWKWSFYRIVDILSLGISLGLAVVVLGLVGLQGRFEFLFAFAAWIFLFALLSNIRNTRIKSGYAFIIFLAMNALLGLIFFSDKQNLIFYLLLVTLSTVVFIFRWRLANYDSKIIAKLTRRAKSSAGREED